jgi:hypothetical protein
MLKTRYRVEIGTEAPAATKTEIRAILSTGPDATVAWNPKGPLISEILIF